MMTIFIFGPFYRSQLCSAPKPGPPLGLTAWVWRATFPTVASILWFVS